MMMAASASPADQQRVAQMMARRKTLNPNQRKMPQGIDPSAITKQNGQAGIVGRGGNFQPLGAAAAGRMGMPQGTPPIMAAKPAAMPPGGLGGGMVRPMTPEMVAQAQANAGQSGAQRTDLPGSRPVPGSPQTGGIDSMERSITLGSPAGPPPGFQSAPGAAPGAAGGFRPADDTPWASGGMGLSPELMQRLQSLQAAGFGPGAQGDPSGGRGFVPPGQGAPGGAMAQARPYGLQSFYGA